jgi:hypothetical protein
MTMSLRKRVGALAFACLLLLGGAAEALAQYRVRVYNPNVYSRTRRTMSNRAAVRAALKRKKQRQKARRKALRRTVN